MDKRIVTIGMTAALLLSVGVSTAYASDEPSAADAEQTHSVVVRFAPETLDGEDSRENLQARIETAARVVCGPVEIKDFHARRLWQRCYEAAVASAVTSVESERVAAARN